MDEQLLISALRNQRADLSMYRELLHASFVTMTPQAREDLLHNFNELSGKLIAATAASREQADDPTLHGSETRPTTSRELVGDASVFRSPLMSSRDW